MTRLLDRVDGAAVLADQRGRAVNYDAAEVDGTWNHDEYRTLLAHEPPGDPVPDGPWETACRLVAAYEMADPAQIHAVYDPRVPLEGRDLVLEGRFWFLRFSMGVRITEVIEHDRGDERTWGWAYETLEGHLERGRMSYEVVKNRSSGEITFVIRAFSEGAPTLGPVTGLGWRLFGRRTQLRFYRACGTRMVGMVAERSGDPDPVPPRATDGGLVLAPSDARPRRAVGRGVRRHEPGERG